MCRPPGLRTQFSHEEVEQLVQRLTQLGEDLKAGSDSADTHEGSQPEAGQMLSVPVEVRV